MTDEKSGTRSSVGLLDIVTPRARPAGGRPDDPAWCDHRIRGPPVGEDVHRQGVPGPRGTLRRQGLPQVRRSGDHLSGGQRDRQPLRRGAGRARRRPRRRRRHHAAQLPEPVLLMLAAVKCGAVSGMLNYHQRGDVLEAQPRAAESPRSSSPTPTSSIRSTKAAPTPPGRSRSTSWSGSAATAPTSNPATAAACWPRTRRSTSSPRAPPGCRRPAS